jgi:RNA 3'-terminal phosphate cyclase-like protein
VDSIKAGGLPVLKKFILVDDGLELKIEKRGVPPGGGGQVTFRCPLRKLRPQQVCFTVIIYLKR